MAMEPLGHRLDLLSADEKELAARKSGLARRRLVSSRAGQRLALSLELGLEAPAVPIERRCGRCGAESHGKPSVANSDLQYSASHSGDCLIVAVSMRGPIGCDIEPEANAGLARAVMSRWAGNTRDLGPRSSLADLYAWTELEAISKMSGEGLFGITAGQRSRQPKNVFSARIALAAGYAGTVVAQDEFELRQVQVGPAFMQVVGSPAPQVDFTEADLRRM